MELNQRVLTMANGLQTVLKGSKLDNAEVLEVLGFLQRYYSIPERPRLNPAGLGEPWSAYRPFSVIRSLVQQNRSGVISFTVNQIRK